MNNDGDTLLDRKRLKDRLSLWRLLAIVSLFGLLAIYADMAGGKPSVGRDYIAEVTIDGIMLDDEKRDAMFEAIAKDHRAKALIVRLNSPGGTNVAGQELYLQLREVAKHKPVVGYMRTVCASACYMASLGTDYIIARKGSVTGSIGVMMQAVEVSRLAERLGITPITVKSSKFKDAPSFTSPFTEEERAVVKQVVDDAYDQFVEIIAERRPLSEAEVRLLADGRVYTGRQAAENKLVDALGGKKEALAWLQGRKVDTSLNLKEIKPEPEFGSLMDKLAQSTGIKIFDRLSMGLDGLISIWQSPVVQ